MSGIENDVLVIKNVNFDYTSNPPHNGIVSSDGQLLIGSTADPNIAMVANTLTEGTGIEITNGPGTITISSTASQTDLHTARYIVSSSGTNGTGANYTTITAAIAAAQVVGVNATIFIQPGTYTENFTLPANINLVAYIGDALTPNVTIVGNITCSDAGSRSISGIRLQTNGAACLTVSGSVATVVNLDNCYINCANATGISFTSSSASSQINIRSCRGDLGTTGIGLFSHSSSGTLGINKCNFFNTGGSTTASTCSAGSINISKSGFTFPITTSGTSQTTFEYTTIDTNSQNATSLTIGGSGVTQLARFSRFASGSAAAVSIGSSLTMSDCEINSSNSNPVTGAGTLNYTPFNFTGIGKGINVTTRVPLNYGTWTPTIDGSTPGTTTYTVQAGFYTIVGNLVYIEGRISISAATGTGNAIIGGLPFTVKNLTNYLITGHMSLSSNAWTWSGSGTQLKFSPQPNTTTGLISSLGSAVASNLQMVNGSAVFVFNSWYQI